MKVFYVKFMKKREGGNDGNIRKNRIGAASFNGIDKDKIKFKKIS